MSAFANVEVALERATRLRRRTPMRTKFDCPICRRKRRVELAPGRDGRVLLCCHAGCETQALLDRAGLGWSDLFEDVSYAPPTRSAERLVLDATTPGERWTITPHDFGDDAELALAVEIAEHLLPARHRVRDQLRLRTGRRIAWEQFPLTVQFMMAIARKLGRPIGEHRAARLIHILTARGLIEQVEWLNIRNERGSRRFRVFQLAPATRASWNEKLANAIELARASGRSPRNTHDPATSLVLAAGDGLSSTATTATGAFVRVTAGHDRAPPSTGGRA